MVLRRGPGEANVYKGTQYDGCMHTKHRLETVEDFRFPAYVQFSPKVAVMGKSR